MKYDYNYPISCLQFLLLFPSTAPSNFMQVLKSNPPRPCGAAQGSVGWAIHWSKGAAETTSSVDNCSLPSVMWSLQVIPRLCQEFGWLDLVLLIPSAALSSCAIAGYVRRQHGIAMYVRRQCVTVLLSVLSLLPFSPPLFHSVPGAEPERRWGEGTDTNVLLRAEYSVSLSF